MLKTEIGACDYTLIYLLLQNLKNKKIQLRNYTFSNLFYYITADKK